MKKHRVYYKKWGVAKQLQGLYTISPQRRHILLFLLPFLCLACAKQSAESQRQQSFEAWVKEFKTEAITSGIDTATFDQAFTGIQENIQVVELDKRQPEGSMTFDEYIEKVIPESRVAKARAMLAENKTLLEKVSRKYGVQPRFIVALWGIESNFGQNTGGYSVVEALATLAYEGRRRDFFKAELLKALRIIQDKHISAAGMKGSWAGAMGHSQFMPSSFLNFAQDFNGDGRKDIWNDKADVFASIANYLHQSGWKGNETWGMPVKAPSTIATDVANFDVIKSLAEWQKLGVLTEDGKNLPATPLKASLIYGNYEDGPAFLVYDNYRVILKWNRSRFFATAVGLLADGIGE